MTDIDKCVKFSLELAKFLNAQTMTTEEAVKCLLSELMFIFVLREISPKEWYQFITQSIPLYEHMYQQEVTEKK